MKLKPDSIVYSIDQHGMSETKELTALRMILLAKNGYYVYLDFPKGKENMIRETRIPIHKDKNGIRCLEAEDIIQFIEKESGKNLRVFFLDNSKLRVAEFQFFLGADRE